MALYKKRNDKTETDCYNYLKTLNLPRLTDDKSRLCEGELTKRECWEALQTMRDNKSPGNDGLSKEFYVCFFKEIHSYLLGSLNMSFRDGQLSSSQGQAVIVLLEKRTRTIGEIWFLSQTDFPTYRPWIPLLKLEDGNGVVVGKY